MSATDDLSGYRWGPDGKVIHPTCCAGHQYCPMNDAPHKRHVITIQAMGDTREVVAQNLHRLADQYASGQPFEIRPTGGPLITGEMIVHAYEDPTITPEGYRAATDDYLDDHKARRADKEGNTAP